MSKSDASSQLVDLDPETLRGDRAGLLRATAVIVLYQMTPEKTPAFRSLISARAKLDAEAGTISIVLWDNSPLSHRTDAFPPNVSYFHDPRNLGVATAYNETLEIAALDRSEWLITLDQDTNLPDDYLVRMAQAARICEGDAGIGAIVPQIAMGKKRLSPHHLMLGAIPQWYPRGYRGIPEESVFAFNSGAMVRVNALSQIGGYDTRFPLEYSDTAMFHQLHRHGKKVFIEGSIHLDHEFSLIDMNRVMSVERYRNTLLAETAFWDMNMNALAGCERFARLLMRLIRQWIRQERKDLRNVTREFLMLRLLRSKQERIARWREQFRMQAGLRGDVLDGGEPGPKVSVCMAAYNGGEYIEAQLSSILRQLRADDEVVIVDDGSSDDTVERVMGIRDERIRLYRHEKNMGVVATFEDALRSATGDILFLCDDDDLWATTKVQKVLDAFESQPEALVVMSRTILIDERGTRLPDGPLNRYGRFLSGFWNNIFKNHYQGAAMAIRASLLGQVLPFPRQKSFLHDAWIGTRNEVTGGKTVFIDEPLLYYRRHSNNASQRHPPLRQVKLRIELLLAHLSYALQFKAFRNARVKSG